MCFKYIKLQRILKESCQRIYLIIQQQMLLIDVVHKLHNTLQYKRTVDKNIRQATVISFNSHQALLSKKCDVMFIYSSRSPKRCSSVLFSF